MSGDSCSYDCHVASEFVPSNTDISGIGVIASYVVTAFFVVIITSSYYLFTYQPNLDPFRKADGTQDQTAFPKYRSNPIDKIFLSWLAKWLPRKPERGNGFHTRVEKALIKCVRNMSDLQIVTGLSILISGFSQLRCGLSVYHWQVLVYLAWFSSLTHLCCLTFLGNYLFNHPGQRLWRLISMFIIIIMLVVALVPTGNFDWLSPSKTSETFTPPLGSYAICFFESKPPRIFDNGKRVTPNSYLSMIISSLLLLSGFLTRVIRLHKTLSINLTQRLRSFLSERARNGLRRVYAWCPIQARPQSLRRSLVYHPLLAGFLMLRVLLDMYSSMLMEVWWLLIGFTWGMIHLVFTLSLSKVGVGNGDWSFGQIVPIVLLAAPAISVVEFFYEDDNTRRYLDASTSTSNSFPEVNYDISDQPPLLPLSYISQRSNAQTSENNFDAPPNTAALAYVQNSDIAGNQPHSSINILRDEPDFDFYNETNWFIWIVVYTLLSVCAVSICVVVYTALGTPMALFVLYPIPWLWWKWSFFGIPLTFLCFILFIIMLEDLRLQAQESRARDLVYTGANAMLSIWFLFQLAVFKVTLPIEDKTPTADIWLSWLTVVVPLEVYLFITGYRVKTLLAFFLTLFVGLLVFMVMLRPLMTALSRSGSNAFSLHS